jgi:hypothetical protein
VLEKSLPTCLGSGPCVVFPVLKVTALHRRVVHAGAEERVGLDTQGLAIEVADQAHNQVVRGYLQNSMCLPLWCLESR